MDTQTFPLKPERLAELADYAKRHDQDEATALDSALAEFFAWERADYAEAVEGIRRGYEDMKAGRTQPLEEFIQDLRVEHGLSR
jgi:predicted transcriptional regulator